MTIDLDDLEKLADAAPKGPWHEDRLDDNINGLTYRQSMVQEEGGRIICDTLNADYMWTEEERSDIGEFIAAANPATIKALIARIRELEHRLANSLPVGKVGSGKTGETPKAYRDLLERPMDDKP